MEFHLENLRFSALYGHAVQILPAGLLVNINDSS